MSGLPVSRSRPHLSRKQDSYAWSVDRPRQCGVEAVECSVVAKVVDTFSRYVSAQTPKRLLMVSHESYTAINEYLISAVNGSTRSMASCQFQIGMTSPPPSCSKNREGAI